MDSHEISDVVLGNVQFDLDFVDFNVVDGPFPEVGEVVMIQYGKGSTGFAYDFAMLEPQAGFDEWWIRNETFLLPDGSAVFWKFANVLDSVEIKNNGLFVQAWSKINIKTI